MPAKKNTLGISWGLVVSITAPVVLSTFVAITAFYYQTNSTLKQHEDQFKIVGSELKASRDEFKAFGETSRNNFAEWMKLNKVEQEKAELAKKEDREARDKMREQFMSFVTNLNTSAAATKIQVEMAVKQLDAVTTKLDNITNVQQQNRQDIIRSQSTGSVGRR